MESIYSGKELEPKWAFVDGLGGGGYSLARSREGIFATGDGEFIMFAETRRAAS